MIDRLAIAGYRSLRSMVLSLGQLNVVTGANGSGKSNLYRALRLLADVGQGQLIRSLSSEGGFDSVRWAGPETLTREMIRGEIPVEPTLRSKPVSLKLGILADPFSYSMELGLPQPSGSMFSGDPELKRECLWRGRSMDARNMCADRRYGTLRARSERGNWRELELPLTGHDSMLARYADPVAAPELIVMRETMRSWRFYDTFRTDADAPARRLALSTFTPVVAGDGNDLAAALQTIREIGDDRGLNRIIDEAFPGSRLSIGKTDFGLQLRLKQPGMLRDLTATELSDGTLRFLLLVAALLTPRPPSLMVLNEPENSLHPSLIPALAQLIQLAAENSQLVVVSHRQSLVDLLQADEICVPIRLTKRLGETVVEGSDALGQVGWNWPKR